jgi:hypothetical protein
MIRNLLYIDFENLDNGIIDEALMSEEAIIVGSPTYVLVPTGNFKTVCVFSRSIRSCCINNILNSTYYGI